MTNSAWYVHDFEDGAFAIYEPSGEIRAKFANPAVMATHFAAILEENDRLRAIIDSLAARVKQQSDLLTARAEREVKPQ